MVGSSASASCEFLSVLLSAGLSGSRGDGASTGGGVRGGCGRVSATGGGAGLLGGSGGGGAGGGNRCSCCRGGGRLTSLPRMKAICPPHELETCRRCKRWR